MTIYIGINTPEILNIVLEFIQEADEELNYQEKITVTRKGIETWEVHYTTQDRYPNNCRDLSTTEEDYFVKVCEHNGMHNVRKGKRRERYG